MILLGSRTMSTKLFILTLIVHHSCMKITKSLTNESQTIERNTTLSSNHQLPLHIKCSIKNPDYCHGYVRNVIAMYTQTGGWIMLAVVLCGILLQIASHVVAFVNGDERTNAIAAAAHATVVAATNIRAFNGFERKMNRSQVVYI